MTEMMGRLHPLLVHLPIGILLLAAVFELLSCFKRYRKLRSSVRAMIFFGALSSTLSVITGLSLAADGAYDDRLIGVHKNSGIITTVFAWIIFFARDSIITLFKQKRKRRLIRVFLFIPLIVLVGLTGHMGGSLTHGEDYLFGSSEAAGEKSLRLSLQGEPDSAHVYADIIAPILDTRCYSCHGPTKQKGQLRLDQPRFIVSGGKHGEVLDAIHPDSAELYKRLVLPLEDEHHMPPNEKSQLASAELALIHSWLAEGAPFDKRVAELHAATTFKRYLQVLVMPSQQQDILPAQEVKPANEASVAALVSQGVLVIPLGDSTHYLSVSYVNARTVSEDQLALLIPIKDQLLSLDVGRTALGNEAMKYLTQLTALKKLNLQYTNIADPGLKGIDALNQLQQLNLVGTRITDAGLQELGRLKSLKKVYCYGTQVTKAGVAALSSLRPGVAIDTGGYQLPVRVTDTLEHKAPAKP